MNTFEGSKSNTEELRKTIETLADYNEGGLSYSEKLQEMFDELSRAMDSTIGKIRGGDTTAENISEEGLIELQQKIEKLKRFSRNN